MHKSIFHLVVLFTVFFSVSGFSGNRPDKISHATSLIPETYVPNTVIVKLKSSEIQAQQTGGNVRSLNALFKKVGKKTFQQIYLNHGASTSLARLDKPAVDLSLIYELTFSSTQKLEDVLLKLRADSNVMYAEPKFISKSLYTPNDPNTGSQYYLNLIKAFQGWDFSKGDSNIVIGVTDEGFDLTHPDLVNSIKYNYKDPIDGIDNDNDHYIDNYSGWNVASNNNNVTVDGSLDHGVAVAGLAAATTDNLVGMAGTAFKCKFLPVKIQAGGVLKNEFMSIVYAADHGCQIINCSWGHVGGGSQYEQDIINYATSKNCLIVAAAGNNNDDGVFYPASYEYVISVGATNNKDQKGIWSSSKGPVGSNFGSNLDVCAPGVAMYTTVKNGGYVNYANGTSFACPVASGCAAIIKSKFPSYTGLQVGERLRATCDFIDTVSGNAIYAGKLGRGRINLQRALTLATPSVRFSHITRADGKGDNFLAGDTMALYGIITNFLDPTTNLTITLSTTSPYITLLNKSLNLGVLGTLNSLSNKTKPFIVSINPNTPLFTKVTFKLSYNDGPYVDYQYFDMVVNPDYITLAINNISTSITSNGTFGYSHQTEGIGFNYKNNGLIYAGGLVLNSNTKTVDAIYGATPNSSDTDFTVKSPVRPVVPSLFSNKDLAGKFTDSLAGAQKIGVLVSQKAYAWNSAADSNYVILEYTIKNTNATKIDSLYSGFYIDWDIDTASQNRADYNATLKMGYVYSTQAAAHFGGVKLLSQGSAFSYAIDNPGGTGLIGIYNGFTKASKQFAIKNNRYAAGTAGKGNDVSQMVSTGPFFLAPGDSVKVAFAVTGGTSTSMINAAAIAADYKYNKPIITVKGKLTICPGDSTVLTSSVAASYKWSTGALTRSIVVKNPGTYTVSVPGSAGISLTSDAIKINSVSSPTVISTSKGTLFCAGDTNQLSASPSVAYLWSTGATTQSINITQAGTYKVTSSNSAICKSSSASITLTTKTPQMAQVLAEGPTTFCQGGSTTLLASSGSSYHWSNGATTQGIAVSSGGFYSVKIRGANGCTGQSTPVNVIVHPAPIASISANGPTAFCFSDSVLLTAVSAAAYKWSSGATTNSISVHSSGDYSATIHDAEGCAAISNTIHVLVDSGPQKPVIIQSKNAISAAAAAPAYQWYLNNKPVPGATDMEFVITTNGTYTLRAFDLQGCSRLSEPLITSSALAVISHQANLFTLLQNQPNPCSKNTTIQFSLLYADNVDLSIYNLLGERIYTICAGNFPAGIHEYTVDVSALSDGLYYYRLQAKGNRISKKLVVLNK